MKIYKPFLNPQIIDYIFYVTNIEDPFYFSQI